MDITAAAGYTALHHASFNGNQDSVKELIDAGADVNLLTKKEGTAAEYAKSRGHTEIVALLENAAKASEVCVGSPSNPCVGLSYGTVQLRV